MTRPVAVLRPEPGNAGTMARVTVAGLTAIALPLFEVRALDWVAPDPAAHDGLLFTSASAARHGGAQLARLRGLPVFAVGEKTATAARAAGFDVMASGDTDAAAILALAAARGYRRLLHLAGRERASGIGEPVNAVIEVYASEALPVTAAALGQLRGSVALLHSARAARRLGNLVDEAALTRGDIAVAAISAAVAEAAGSGWHNVAVATDPRDDALIAAARTLID